MKRTDRSWSEIQTAYDNGMTWRQIKNIFQICDATLAWARKNGNLKCRSMSDAAKLSWKVGTQNADVFRTPEHRKIMSKIGGYRERSGRCKHIKYLHKNGSHVDLQGTWELKFVSFLDSQNIKWTRNRVGYKYFFNSKEHQYFPDFFLEDLDVYVEVKGYETEKDRAKWNQFPYKLIVVKKQEIQDLTAWWNEIKL